MGGRCIEVDREEIMDVHGERWWRGENTGSKLMKKHGADTLGLCCP